MVCRRRAALWIKIEQGKEDEVACSGCSADMYTLAVEEGIPENLGNDVERGTVLGTDFSGRRLTAKGPTWRWTVSGG